MNDKLGDKELDKRIKAILAGHRKRGRPPSGFGKAHRYTDQYWELRRQGISRWTAKKGGGEALFQNSGAHLRMCKDD